MVRRGWIVAAFAAALAACGGGSTGTSARETRAPEVTKEAFIAEADKICAELNEAAEALGEPSTPQEAATYIERLLTPTHDALQKLRTLQRPVADEIEIARILAGFEDATSAAEDLLQQLEGGDGAAIEAAFTKMIEVTEAANKRAGDYGMKDCAE